ncbi:MAG: hypothetical protein P8020_18090 [Acidobacteriota bacterium]
MVASRLFTVIVLSLMAVGSRAFPANKPRIPEFVVEISGPGSTIPRWIGVEPGGGTTSMESFELPDAPGRRVGVISYFRWLPSGQLSFRLEYYPECPNVPRLEEQFLSKLTRMDMGFHLLATGQVFRFGLPDTAEVVEMSLRRNVPDRPARLNIGESPVQSVQIGDIIETRGSFHIELINRSQIGIHALAFDQGAHGGQEHGGGLYGSLLAPGESHWATLGKTGTSARDLWADFTLRTVVFDDGSFEGDPGTAVRILAEAWGAAEQLRRALPKLEEAALRGTEDAGGSIDHLLDEFSEPETESDVDLPSRIATRYPRFSEEPLLDSFKASYRSGAQAKRESLRRELASFAQISPEMLPAVLRDHFERTRSNLEYAERLGLVPQPQNR